ncbi:MAG: type II 3-dehydroquinate dehydratase [Betaproteobacteria bacterium]
MNAESPTDIIVINGPNLNLLGSREPEIYGTETLKEIESRLTQTARELGVSLECHQTNHEGHFVETIHLAKKLNSRFLILNAAAYTHTSVAIRDALSSVQIPYIEVHLSNVYRREAFRHHSYLSEKAEAVICGLGSKGYDAALQYAIDRLRENV